MASELHYKTMPFPGREVMSLMSHVLAEILVLLVTL